MNDPIKMFLYGFFLALDIVSIVLFFTDELPCYVFIGVQVFFVVIFIVLGIDEKFKRLRKNEL